MAGTPIDLSTYKPVAGQGVAAAPIANAMTAIETYTGNAIDPASLLQKAATIGQALVWNGTSWAPGAPAYPIAPTVITTIPSGGAVAPQANFAYLVPIGVVCPTPVSRIALYIAAGGGANHIDVGIYYSDDESTATRLVSKGSTLTPVTNATQVAITPTTMTPLAGRRWYLAFACDSATPTFGMSSLGGVPGFYGKASSFPLPASITSMASQFTNAPALTAMV